jgi:copper resistance protein B
VNIAAQDVPELGIGSGLSSIKAGLRLRYEFAREFAPYIGVNWERQLGDTARYARMKSERPSVTSLVMGICFWF